MGRKKAPKRKLLKGTSKSIKKLVKPEKGSGGHHRITILAKLKKSFNDEDREEPFKDREYVDETNRIYSILMEEWPADQEDSKDRAIFDIVADVFRACGKEVE